MSYTRYSFKLLSMGFVLSLFRILNEHLVLAENGDLTPKALPQSILEPEFYNAFDDVAPTINSLHDNECVITPIDFIERENEAIVVNALNDEAVDNAYDHLTVLLRTEKAPMDEVHQMLVMIDQLKRKGAAQLNHETLFLYCYFIEAVHPNSEVGIFVKNELVEVIRRWVPDIHKARLDYYVLIKDFDTAAKYLHDDVPGFYSKSLDRHRLRMPLQHILPSLSLIALLRCAQVKEPPLPMTHPIFHAIPSDNLLEEMISEIKVRFIRHEVMEVMLKDVDEKIPKIVPSKGITKTEIDNLYYAQRNADRNPLLGLSFRTTAALLSVAANVMQNNREMLRQLMISFIPEGRFLSEPAYMDLFRLIENDRSQFNEAEKCLFLRFLLEHSHRLDQIQRRIITADYLTIILDDGVINAIIADRVPLYLTYDEREEKLIRKSYPEKLAERIIQSERRLMGFPLLEWDANVKVWMSNFLLMVGLVVVELVGHQCVSGDARKIKENQSENRRKKMLLPSTEFNPPVTIIQNKKSLSDMMLATISDLLAVHVKDGPSMDTINKTNPLPFKTGEFFLIGTPELEPFEIRFPLELNEKLIEFYRNHKKAFEDACQLEGVRQTEALEAIKARCWRLVVRHLGAELDALSGGENKMMVSPQNVPVSIREKIDRLLTHEKFPTYQQSAWVKLPTVMLYDLQNEVQSHSNDPTIKTQLNVLEQLNDALIALKGKLDGLKVKYLALIKDYDKLSHPTDKVLAKLAEDILDIQTVAESVLTEIADKSKQYDFFVLNVQRRYDQLAKTKIQPQESKEERVARIQRIRDEKKRKKDEDAAKERAETEAQARQLAFANQRQAEKERENKERLKTVLFYRWEKLKDFKINSSLLYAHIALLTLGDVMNSEKKDDDYLRDVCILSGTQLYEALKNLSETLFSQLLPQTNDLAQCRNMFAHAAMFSNLKPEQWKMIARDCYHHFFAFVDAYHQVKPSGESQGEPIYVRAMPVHPLGIDSNRQFSKMDKKIQFTTLCQRYLVFRKQLHAISKDEKMVYQDRAINLLLIAMRSLVMQIDDLGKQIGFGTSSNKNIALLAVARNQEAHNGDPTNAATLLNLSKPIKALMHTVKLPNKVAQPSQVGLYRENKINLTESSSLRPRMG